MKPRPKYKDFTPDDIIIKQEKIYDAGGGPAAFLAISAPWEFYFDTPEAAGMTEVEWNNLHTKYYRIGNGGVASTGEHLKEDLIDYIISVLEKAKKML